MAKLRVSEGALRQVKLGDWFGPLHPASLKTWRGPIFPPSLKSALDTVNFSPAQAKLTVVTTLAIASHANTRARRVQPG
jgi:hypothetical protein